MKLNLFTYIVNIIEEQFYIHSLVYVYKYTFSFHVIIRNL